MVRRLHAWPGLVFGAVLALTAASGAVLSVSPALERANAPAVGSITIAEAADRALEANPGLQTLTRSANGTLKARVKSPEGQITATLDPATGAASPMAEDSAAMGWIMDFHRSFQAGDAGRAAAGGLALTMSLMAVSGAMLLVLALGGWRRLGGPVRTGGARGWHARLGRFALAGLSVSALTGLWLSAATFGFVPGANEALPPPAVAAKAPALPPAEMAALRLPLDQLRSLTMPRKAGDSIQLVTNAGQGRVDPSTGKLLVWETPGLGATVWEWAYALHTGAGLWAVGLVLGLSAALAPALAITGTLIWWARRRRSGGFAQSVAMDAAEVVILVGSEGGSTRGFAASLARAVAEAGRAVHLADMNDIGPMPKAEALILLAATWGEGAAPASAARFLERFGAARPVPFAVLGFGERSYPAFCGYAETVAKRLAGAGWREILPMGRVDRASPSDFAAWGRKLGEALGLEIAPEHRPDLPRLHKLALAGRRDYGEAVQAPSAILSFKVRPWWLGGPRFEAGDLLGVLAPGAAAPRFYSLASSSREGVAEICLRKVPGGVCSTMLHGLATGERIQAFIRRNAAFHDAGDKPLVMVAAGCGIGPMAGFLRKARAGAERALYFGLRDPKSDFFYQEEIRDWRQSGLLGAFRPAVSRADVGAGYVQDKIREDAAALRERIRAGARVMVCGSTAMGRAVAAEFEAVLAPVGLSVATLKREGRYVEDVY